MCETGHNNITFTTVEQKLHGQFHTYSQWFVANFNFFQNFKSWKMLKMLKKVVLSIVRVSQVSLKVFPCSFLLNSGECHVVVTSFTHIHSGFQQILFFQKFC